ncbi:ATP-grasp domain-containing protein [Rhizobium etli]|uniref:ATP-grasp domain-containing protein n=1 Tax=Rhizobium etli TaxID=29449 RepID=UPI0003839C6B|nr:acetyl-CoA carboxylase biotin carboxylase subunit family protein [Rhizobium etli]AGS25379.1 biotin carboxylase protein [Rhizobium etli bv. mimosae str. Mim1]
MERRAFIMVEGHRGSGPLFMQGAERMGLHPITLSADPARFDYLSVVGAEAIRVDTNNLDALIRECSRLHSKYGIAGITGFAGDDESIYATVGKLCRYFDLPGPNPASVDQCRDKFVQRQLLAEAGVPMPAYRLALDAKDVERSAAEIGLPVIIKPAEGSGSLGVRLCRNSDELEEHTTYLLSGKHIWRSSPRILVEEFAQGPHYLAAMMGNEVIGFGVAEYGPPPHFVFRELTFPAQLTDDQRELAADISLRCLRALGLGWGPTNIELRWTRRGPVVIEVNPRLAGAPEPQLIELAYGVHLISEYIKLISGQEWKLRKSRSYTAVARTLMPERDGTLDWIDGDWRAAAVSGVAEVRILVESKRPIVRRGDHGDRLGYVIAAAPTLADTKGILQHAVGLIKWSITPFSTLEK